MARYAAPNYMNSHIAPFEAMPPGHRFGLFFKSWNHQWGIDDTGKKDGLKETLKLDEATLKLLQALRLRQVGQAQSLTDPPWRISAVSESPFMTGIGMGHPLENGFAFLNPYGLPYLPGSGVKGVLRRAAEDLALDNAAEDGWNLLAVWWLFGFDASSVYLAGKPIAPLTDEARQWRDRYRQKIDTLATSPYLAPFIETVLSGRGKADYLAQPARFLEDLGTNRALREKIHLRGALCFWDVVPEPGGNQLGMDILTPHHGDYYQGKSAPNDCGQPIPNQFLVMPAGSRFVFHVQCNSIGLPDSLAESWRKLLETSFEQAFDWLGFGAKTAVGYGQMCRNDQALEELSQLLLANQRQELQRHEAKQKLAEEAARQAELEAMSPVDRQLYQLSHGKLHEHEVVELFTGLGGMGEADRIKAALAFKELWISTNKWSKKDCSKKQWEKVQRLRDYLGEA